MKKAGVSPLPLVSLVALLGFALLAAFLRCFLVRAARLLVHAGLRLVGLLLHAAGGLLVHALGVFLVLRERGKAGSREHRRDENRKELLHSHPLPLVVIERRANGRSPLLITHEVHFG